MKRFGFAKFAPKPKTEKDWVRIYNRHKYEVPTVKKLTLALSAKGPGQTGARYAFPCQSNRHYILNWIRMILNQDRLRPLSSRSFLKLTFCSSFADTSRHMLLLHSNIGIPTLRCRSYMTWRSLSSRNCSSNLVRFLLLPSSFTSATCPFEQVFQWLTKFSV